MMITIIVPTYKEHGNVPSLVSETYDCLNDVTPVRMLFVDDSPDLQTAEAVTAAAMLHGSDRFIVDVIHREGDERIGGLASAVTDGIKQAGTDFVAVMDGDGQHPPIVLAHMYRKLQGRNLDVVVGSRYRKGGSAEGLDGIVRQLASRVSTWAAISLFPHSLREITDPMSGCFMVRRDRVCLEKLRPEGFKILLEILVTHEHLRRAEVPLRFRARAAGKSKGTLALGITYLRQLMKLRFATAHYRKVS